MTNQKFTIGSYEFQAITRIEPVFMRPAAIGKLLCVNRSVVANWGTYGATPYYVRGSLTGATGKTDLWLIVDELNRPDPVKIQANVLGAYTAWGQVLSFTPVEKPGYNIDGVSYAYDFDIVFVQSMRSDEGSRGVQYGAVQESDTFGLTGDVVAPLPVVATGTLETVDFTRYIDDGAAGTLAVPCVLTPDLTSITYTATEANMSKGVVTLSRNNRQWRLSNGTAAIETCHESGSNKGYVTFHYYDGAAWITGANLRGWVTQSGGALEEITSSSRGPDVWPIFPGDRYRQGLRMLYPATSGDSLVGLMEFEMEYGRPTVKWYIENGCSTDLTAARYQVDPVPTSFTFWTRSGAEVNASGTVYGTVTVSGDAESQNVQYLQTTTGAPSGSEVVLAIGRKKMADADRVAIDAGDYWSTIAQDYDNVTIKQGYKFEPIWLNMGVYSKGFGSRTATNLASENLARVTVDHTIIPNLY